MSPEPYRLTELTEQPPGLRRAIHGYSTAGTWSRLARRVGEVGLEVARSLPRDVWRRWRPGPPPLLRLEAGVELGHRGEQADRLVAVPEHAGA